MKSFIIVAMIACTGLLVACEKTSNNNQPPSDYPYVNLGECINTVFSGNTVTLCFDSLLGDSRCPADVVCVWQGVATCKFIFTADNQSHLLTLSTAKLGSVYIKDTTVSGYKVEFINLTPYPRTTGLSGKGQKPRAEVKITKL